MWSASALRAENVPRRLAVSPIVLPFLGKREVAVFQICRPSLAAGLLGFFTRTDPLIFLWEKHGFSVSSFSFPKSVPLAQAEPRAALALISGPRLLPSGRAGGGGVGEGRVGGVGGRGGPSRPSPPWASRAGAARRPRSAPRRPGLGVSLPPAVSADAEGRCPSRAEGTRPGRRAGPGAGARACARARARQKLR